LGKEYRRIKANPRYKQRRRCCLVSRDVQLNVPWTWAGDAEDAVLKITFGSHWPFERPEEKYKERNQCT
jgi:hypothetical protein